MTHPLGDALGDVERYFTEKLREHGPTARGVDWNSQASQELRFEQLLRIVDDSQPFSLIDYGCGYGALAQYLLDRDMSCTYQGFDISAAMLAQARRMMAGEQVRFVGDEAQLVAADYVVASGIFNLRMTISDDMWLTYILETLNRMHALSLRGFAFNILTSYSDRERMRPDLYYADPRVLFDHCKRTFSRFVAVLHDYPLYEFTILVRK